MVKRLDRRETLEASEKKHDCKQISKHKTFGTEELPFHNEQVKKTKTVSHSKWSWANNILVESIHPIAVMILDIYLLVLSYS